MRNSTVEQQLIECGWKDRRGLDLIDDCGKEFSKAQSSSYLIVFLRIAATHVVSGLHRLCFHTIQKKPTLPIPRRSASISNSLSFYKVITSHNNFCLPAKSMTIYYLPSN